MMGIIVRSILLDLGHMQPPTPVRTDNTTNHGIVHDSIKQIRSRTIDMRFHSIRDRMLQGQFHIYWDAGVNNLADYYTKHHPPWHQFKMRPVVMNNPPNTKYYSGKGVLVVPRRGPKTVSKGPNTGLTTTVNKTVISQSKVFTDHLNKLRTWFN